MHLTRTTPRNVAATNEVGVVMPAIPPVSPGLEKHFHDFYDRMHGPALDYARRFAPRREAEEAVQDAMGDVWLSWVTRGPDPLTQRFFIGIVVHKVRDQRRAIDGGPTRRMVSLEDAEEELETLAFARSGQLTREDTRGDTRGDVLDLAIAALPPKRREVFLLANEHEYTYKEVAAVLRVSEGTVKSHLRIATADVRATFAERGYVPAPPRAPRLPAPKPTEGHTND